MKKIFLVLVIGLFASCEKENPQPTQPTQPIECDCVVWHQQKFSIGWVDINWDDYPQGDCNDNGIIINQTMLTRDSVACQ